jgi:hypothetical protein
MNKNFIFHSTCFNQVELRKKLIILKDNSIDFRIENHTGMGSFKAPLSVVSFVDILVEENNFQKADELLKSIL